MVSLLFSSSEVIQSITIRLSLVANVMADMVCKIMQQKLSGKGQNGLSGKNIRFEVLLKIIDIGKKENEFYEILYNEFSTVD